MKMTCFALWINRWSQVRVRCCQGWHMYVTIVTPESANLSFMLRNTWVIVLVMLDQKYFGQTPDTVGYNQKLVQKKIRNLKPSPWRGSFLRKRTCYSSISKLMFVVKAHWLLLGFHAEQKSWFLVKPDFLKTSSANWNLLWRLTDSCHNFICSNNHDFLGEDKYVL